MEKLENLLYFALKHHQRMRIAQQRFWRFYFKSIIDIIHDSEVVTSTVSDKKSLYVPATVFQCIYSWKQQLAFSMS